MAAPITILDVAQVGLEATRGTLVAATSVLDMEPGGAVLKDPVNVIRVRNAGSLATGHRSYPGLRKPEVEIAGNWTYNWAPWWLNLFLGPLAAGTGATADKTWTFDSSVVSDTADNLKSASIELGGKDARPAEYKLAGAMGQKLTLSIKQGEAWKYKATLLATSITEAAKTASLSALASIVDVLGTTTKVYVNDSASAFGATQRVGSLVSAEIEIGIGTGVRYTLDGSRNPTRQAVVGPRVIGAKLVVEYDSQTEHTAAQAATARRVRIESIGPTLGASAYRCTIDLPGTWDAYEWGDDGGVRTEQLTLVGQYDATPAADIAAVVVNASATLP